MRATCGKPNGGHALRPVTVPLVQPIDVADDTQAVLYVPNSAKKHGSSWGFLREGNFSLGPFLDWGFLLGGLY